MTEPERLVGAKVVARYLNGTLLKGYTYDFGPSRRSFHVFVDKQASSPPIPVSVAELKALFSVRDFAGNPRYSERKTVPAYSSVLGQAVEVRFCDGEVLIGFAARMPADEQGFFLVPADPASNNLKAFVPRHAVQGLHPVPRPAPVARARVGSAAAFRPPAPPVRQGRLPTPPSGVLRWLTRGLSAGGTWRGRPLTER